MLQPKCIIAQICAAQHITPLGPEQSMSPQDKPDSDDLEFNLDDSPISEQDKERIINKLKAVQAVHGNDFQKSLPWTACHMVTPLQCGTTLG